MEDLLKKVIGDLVFQNAALQTQLAAAQKELADARAPKRKNKSGDK